MAYRLNKPKAATADRAAAIRALPPLDIRAAVAAGAAPNSAASDAARDHPAVVAAWKASRGDAQALVVTASAQGALAAKTARAYAATNDPAPF